MSSKFKIFLGIFRVAIGANPGPISLNKTIIFVNQKVTRQSKKLAQNLLLTEICSNRKKIHAVKLKIEENERKCEIFEDLDCG
jgi:hypothetical protein